MAQWDYCMLEEVVQSDGEGLEKRVTHAWVKLRLSDVGGHADEEVWSHDNPRLLSKDKPVKQMTLIETHEAAQDALWIHIARLGASGWELVHVLDEHDHIGFRVRYFFKRPRTGEMVFKIVEDGYNPADHYMGKSVYAFRKKEWLADGYEVEEVEDDDPDKEVAEDSLCELCGGKMRYEGLIKKAQWEGEKDIYRGFGVCKKCGAVNEF